MDFTKFGEKQICDLGVSSKDVVFAITEGGETSFVIGTAWAGLHAGAKVYFVYNNPDEILCEHVQRSREVIQDTRIGKINVTSGPMGITGSTRMQATSSDPGGKGGALMVQAGPWPGYSRRRPGHWPGIRIRR